MSAEHAHAPAEPSHDASGHEAPASPAHAEHATPASPAHGGHAANDNAEHPPRGGAAAVTRGEAPIVNAYNKAKNGLTSSASSIVQSTSSFGRWLRKIFRAGELKPVEMVSIPKTPIYAAGNMIDGTALLAPRRAIEVIEPGATAIRAMVRTLGIPFSPFHTILHPIQAIKKPLRIATSALMLNKNIAMAAPRTAHEILDRAIARPIEQISMQLRRIPLIGSLIATPSTWITRKIANITGSVKNGVDWITSPIDHIHNWTSPDGAPVTAPTTPSAPAHAPTHH